MMGYANIRKESAFDKGMGFNSRGELNFCLCSKLNNFIYLNILFSNNEKQNLNHRIFIHVMSSK